MKDRMELMKRLNNPQVSHQVRLNFFHSMLYKGPYEGTLQETLTIIKI